MKTASKADVSSKNIGHSVAGVKSPNPPDSCKFNLGETGVRLQLIDEDSELDQVIELPLSQRAMARTPVKGSSPNPWTLEEIVEEDTGKGIDPQDWQTFKLRELKLKEQTEAFADILESFGVPARLNRDITAVGLVTGIQYELQQYRNINLLPLVAQKNRSQYQKELAFYLQKHPYTRYMVITNGKRIPAFSSLKKSMQKFSRKISKWANEVKNRWDAQVFCRVLELPRNDDGTYHLHANILYELPRLKDDEWQKFLKFTNAYFKTKLKDNGVIRNLDEVVKYPFKPESLDGCAGEELVWLAQELFNTRIFTAMNGFAEFRRWLKDSDLKILIRGGKPSMMRKECFISHEKTEEAEEKRDPVDAENMLLAITPPQYLTPYKEPVALVQGLNWHAKGEKSVSRLADLLIWQTKARDAWHLNGAPDPAVARKYAEALAVANNVKPFKTRSNYIVHNTTISVQEDQSSEGKIIHLKPDREPDPPPKPGGFLDIFH